MPMRCGHRHHEGGLGLLHRWLMAFCECEPSHTIRVSTSTLTSGYRRNVPSFLLLLFRFENRPGICLQFHSNGLIAHIIRQFQLGFRIYIAFAKLMRANKHSHAMPRDQYPTSHPSPPHHTTSASQISSSFLASAVVIARSLTTLRGTLALGVFAVRA